MQKNVIYKDAARRTPLPDLLAPVQHQHEPDNRKNTNLTFQCSTHVRLPPRHPKPSAKNESIET